MPTQKPSTQGNSNSPHKSRARPQRTGEVCSPFHTSGAVFSDGACIELLREAGTGRLCLLVCEGENRTIAPEVQFRGRLYRPEHIDPALLAAMTLPAKCEAFGSTIELFTSVRETFMSYGVPEDPALAVTYFGFASWFIESLPAAPCLLISGPPAEANLLLELLHCAVRHSLPLGEVTRSGIYSLPMYVQPTLLVKSRISRSVSALLSLSNRRDAFILGEHGLSNIFCAKAVYLGDGEERDDFDESVLRINLSPSRGRLPILDPRDRQEICGKLQGKLLGYRCRHLVKVRESRCDFPEFDSGIRILGRILGAPLVDAPELHADLEPLLRERQEGIRTAKWLDLRCVTLEAVLNHCHQDPGKKVHIRDITKTVNIIYRSRGETTEFEPEVIGNILRKHEFSPKRDSQGYFILLDDRTRRHAHLVARRRDVAAVQVGISKCSLCSEILATDGTRTFSDSRSKGQKL